MPITPSEYRARHQTMKTIKLESGEEFVIRKLPLPIYAQFFGMYDIPFTKEMSPAKAKKMMEEKMESTEFKMKMFDAIEMIVPAGVAEPRIVVVAEGEKVPEDVLSLDEIEIGNQLDLFAEIISFQGFDTDFKKFRRKLDRKTSRDLSPSAAHSSK